VHNLVQWNESEIVILYHFLNPLYCHHKAIRDIRTAFGMGRVIYYNTKRKENKKEYQSTSIFPRLPPRPPLRPPLPRPGAGLVGGSGVKSPITICARGSVAAI